MSAYVVSLPLKDSYFGVVKQMAGAVTEKVNSVLQPIAAVVVIVGCASGFGLWLTGGLKPQTQVSVDMLAGKLTELTTSVTTLTTRFDQMPRVSDFAAHTDQLATLARRLDETNNRITRDEIDAAGLRQAVDGMIRPVLPPVRRTQ